MTASLDVLAQIGAMEATVTSNTSSQQGATLLTLAQLGISSPEFQMAALYPIPVAPPSFQLQSNEWLEIIRFFKSHWTPALQLQTLTDLYRYFTILATAAWQAKQSLNGGVIGAPPNGTIFVRMIRPATVFANGGTSIETWGATVAAGWTAGFYVINLVKSSTTKAINTLNNVCMLIVAMTDLSSEPKLGEWQWYDANNRPLNVENATEIQVPGSTGIVPLKQALYIDKSQTFTLDANFFAAGASFPALLGAEFVNGNIATGE